MTPTASLARRQPRHALSARPGPSLSDEPRDVPPLWDSVLFLYGPFALVVMATFAMSVDDSFITLRYAANLVHGYGLAFNPGQRVQGFTSPLDLLVAVVAYLSPFGHALLKMKLASLIFGALAVRESGRLAYGLPFPRWAKRVTCLAIGSSWIVGFSSGNGLETSLEMWVLIALVRRVLLPGGSTSRLPAAGFAFCAVLTRLDAFAPIAGMAAVGLVLERGPDLRRRLAWLWGAVVAGVIVLGGERLYFGTFLPSTYYAKREGLHLALRNGYDYLWGSVQLFEHTVAPLFVHCLAITEAVLLGLGVIAVAVQWRRGAYLIGVIVGQAAFVLMSGGDWLIGGRFIAPAVIPVVMLEMFGLVGLVTFVRRHLRRAVARGTMYLGGSALVAVSVLPLWISYQPVWGMTGLSDKSLLLSGGYAPFSTEWVGLATQLRCLRSGQWAALTEVGYIGFARLDLRILDLRGLNDLQVAKDSDQAERSLVGVSDGTWNLLSDPIGRLILSRHPAVIEDFDSAPQPFVLGHHYRLAGPPGSPYPDYVPNRPGTSCIG